MNGYFCRAFVERSFFAAVFAAVFCCALFAASGRAVSRDVGFKAMLEERYGAESAAGMIALLDGAAADGLPDDFLAMRLREAAAKRVPAAAAEKMLLSRIKSLETARRLSRTAFEAGFKNAAEKTFVARVAEELYAGMSEQAFEALVAAGFRQKNAAALGDAMLILREAKRILGDGKAASDFAVSVAGLGERDMAKLGAYLAVAQSSRAPQLRTIIRDYGLSRDVPSMLEHARKLASGRWKRETESEIADDKKLK